MTLPDGLVLEPAYPDAENVVADILDQLGIPVVTWLPEEFPVPLIWVQRIGGAPDPADITDYPLMRVAWYGEDRQGAWDLSRTGERLLLGYKYRASPGGVLVDHVSIDTGGTLEPDLDPDDRRVTTNFTFGWRRQRPAPIVP